MQYIETKYLGPTTYNGARIKATTSSGKSKIISYPYHLDGVDCHAEALKELMKKLDWHKDNRMKNIICNETDDGYIFIFDNEFTNRIHLEF